MGIPSPGGQGPTNILLNSWSFTDTTNWLSYRGYPPVSFTNLSVSDLGAGTAVVVDSPNPAWLQYNIIESDGATNLSLGLGSLVFWFAPHWAGTNEGGTGPGSPGRLIEVGAYTEDASYGWWSLHTDAEGVNLYFSAQGSDGCETNYLCAPIDWTTNRWHQVALSYSCTNSALYLDGELATNGPPITCLPGAEALANGFFIGSASNGTAQAHGMFDSLATYANPVDAGTVASIFLEAFPYYYLNPLNRASWASAPSYITNTPNFRAISGPGYLEYVGAVSACATNSNVWITNVTAAVLTNGTTTLSFTIMGGDPSLLYDVFGTGELVGNNITNAQWAWLGQGPPCSSYEITNLPSGSAFIILGTPQDSDNDGLTDAYELLVSHTDPHNPDTDGDGIMDWFGPAYFGTSTVDPYALCPSGDGWTLLQAYQNGWDPLAFYTPPTPAVSVTPLPNGNGVVISWQPAPGAVTGYTIFRDGLLLTNLPPSQLSFEDDSVQVYPGDSDSGIPAYQVRASYALGNSLLSPAQQPINQTYAVSTAIVRGPGGQYFLLASPIARGVTAIRVFREAQAVLYPLDLFNELSYAQPETLFTPSVSGDYFDVPATSFVQGQYALPSSAVPPFGSYTFLCRPLGNNGTMGPLSTPSLPMAAALSAFIPFLDGTEQLSENLVFALEAADENGPFQFRLPDNTSPVLPGWIFPSGYAYANYHFPYDFGLPAYNYSLVDEFKPFEDNCFLRNFVYAPTDVNSAGSLTSGVYYNANVFPPIVIPDQPPFSFPEYTYVAQGNQLPISPLLSATDPQWIYSPYQPSQPGWADIGITNVSTNLFLLASQSNSFGLPYQSAKRLYSDGIVLHTDALASGGSIPEVANHTEYFYAQAAPPQLQMVGYFFGVPNRDYLPGNAGFSPTAASTPPFIAAVGQQFALAGWARLAVNGNYNQVAFLEQYFDKAYLADMSGSMTTNQTGILSEYGEFFPTETGLAILTTKTNAYGQPGQAAVQVISLCVDANHDGTMDTSFFGPDFTSPARPFLFWINNDYDRWHTVDVTDREEDDLSSTDANGGCPLTPRTPTPDCEYRDANASRVIPCERDLEDFARLWVCGITSDMLSALPPGSTVTLDWGDVGSPNPANPTIDLFQSVEADGGIGYLTNSATAMLQTNASTGRYVGRLGPGQRLQLNSGQFNGWAGNYFIWCGVSNGTGGLTLTISQGGTTTLAQTSAYIHLQDIKQMYERWTVGDNPNIAPTNTAWLAGEGVLQPFQYGPSPSADTPYILHVHGFNVALWEKDRIGETIFKRLYWQGYQGRLGIFRWPTTTHFYAKTFDDSEFIGWKSAPGLLNLLTTLNSEYPGNVFLTAHSHGNVVAGEALRLAGSNQVVDTYLALQGAIASHAYDPSTPVRTLDSTGVNLDSGTPNRYAQYYTQGAPCYFYASAGAGTYVNFFNTNDWALTLLWRPDQDLKPDLGYHWDGVNFSKGSIPPYLLLLFPVDTYEIFSYCDEARCEAIGAQPNVGGVFATSGQVELDIAPYNFGSQHKFHSGEFRSDNAQRRLFWDTVLRRMGLQN